MWEFKILGPLEVWRDEEELIEISAAQQRAVLVALLLVPNRVVSFDQLIEYLWLDDPPPAARTTLHSLVRRLRHRLDRRLIVAKYPGYLVRTEPGAVDLAVFDDLATRGRAALAADDPRRAGALLQQALALWRGPALADVAAEGLRRHVLPALDERYLDAQEARIEAGLRLGRHAELVTELRGLVSAHPLRERLHRSLMVALHGAGRRSEALAAYRSLRVMLVDELGVEPDTRTQRVHQAMLNGREAVLATRPC